MIKMMVAGSHAHTRSDFKIISEYLTKVHLSHSSTSIPYFAVFSPVMMLFLFSETSFHIAPTDSIARQSELRMFSHLPGTPQRISCTRRISGEGIVS